MGGRQTGDGARAGGRLSELGRRMLRFPVHPRLARLICEGEQRGVADEACLAAALIAERDIRERSRASFGGPAARGGGGGDGDAAVDLLELVDLFKQAAAARFARDRLRALGLDARAVETVDQARRQLVGIARARGPRVRRAPSIEGRRHLTSRPPTARSRSRR